MVFSEGNSCKFGYRNPSDIWYNIIINIIIDSTLQTQR